MAIQSESELYEPVKRFLEAAGYEVKGEVHRCDVVAVRVDDKHPLIVELKKSFNLQLILQAVDRLKLTDSVYVAVEGKQSGRKPSRREWSSIVKLCRMLGIGLMTVHFYSKEDSTVHVHCEPGPYTAKIQKKRASRLLNEFHERSGDYNPGGITGQKLMTVYREQSLRCAYHLQGHETLSPKKLKEFSGVARTASILQNNVYGWFERIAKGKYRLSEEGGKALTDYRDIVNRLFKI